MDEDRSVASGRPMAAIAAGKGRAPQAVHDEWQDRQGRCGVEFESRAGRSSAAARQEAAQEERSPRAKKAAGKRARIPAFIEPELCKPVDRPPGGAGWGHEVKFDGYRLQLRIANGDVTLKTRKGLDWTPKFQAIADAAADFPNAIIDGEVAALDKNGSPDFAAPASRAVRRSHRRSDLLRLRSDVQRRRRSAQRRRCEIARLRLKEYLGEQGQDSSSLIRYVDHFETAGDAVLQSACRMNLEGIISKRLDAPYRAGRIGDWTKSKCRAGQEVVIGGWTQTGSAFRSLLVGVNRGGHLVHVGRVGTGFGGDKVAKLWPQAEEARDRRESFRRQDSAAQETRDPLGEAEAGRRNRVRRLDRWRKYSSGRLQGLRTDKPASEIVAERPAEAEEVDVVEPAPKAARGKAPRTASHASCEETFDREVESAAKSGIECGHGRADLERRQAAVAPRERQDACHQDRARALLRNHGRVDPAAHQGPPVLFDPRARRHRSSTILPAPRDARHVEPAARP